MGTIDLQRSTSYRLRLRLQASTGNSLVVKLRNILKLDPTEMTYKASSLFNLTDTSIIENEANL